MIGRHGRIANALRTIFGAAGMKQHKRVTVARGNLDSTRTVSLLLSSSLGGGRSKGPHQGRIATFITPSRLSAKSL